MARRLLLSMFCTAAILSMPVYAAATSFKSHDDNAVVALDAHTGERRWAHFPRRLSQAACELHPDLLVVRGDVWVQPEEHFVLALDPETGAPLSQGPPGTPPLASSGTFDLPKVVLANGWRLDPGFSRGSDQHLDFLDDQDHVVWTIDTGGYPNEVDAWNNTVFWSFSYLSDEGTVYAYEAGESAPKWTFDPNTRASGTPPLTRPYFRVSGDNLYFGVHEHIFELDPASGGVSRQWDLSALTGIPFESGTLEPTFYGGGLDIGTFSADPETLVVGFERRLVVIDRQSGDLRWHRDPGAFPHDPYPLISGGLLVVTAGEALAGPRPLAPEPPPTTLDRSSGCTVAAPGQGSWWGIAALAAALLVLRARHRASPTGA